MSAQPPQQQLKPLLVGLDLQIVQELERDPLANNQALADRLGLTRSQLLTRLRRITSANVAHVLGVTDLEPAGQSLVYGLVEVRDRATDQVARELADLSCTLVVSSLVGPSDLLVLARRRPWETADAFLRELATVPGVAGVRYELALDMLGGRVNRISFLSATQTKTVAELKAAMKAELAPGLLDELDLCIVAELQADGRKGSREIARNYGVTEGAIRYRLKNLNARGLLRSVAAVDPEALGLSYWAYVEMEVDPQALVDVGRALCERSWNEFLTLMTGETNLHCTVLAQNELHLHRILTEEIRRMPGVRRASSSQMVRNYKADTRWGISRRTVSA
jgi:Lrp/AsnC family transcriptional regulator for asnA, asnC and gidA